MQQPSSCIARRWRLVAILALLIIVLAAGGFAWYDARGASAHGQKLWQFHGARTSRL